MDSCGLYFPLYIHVGFVAQGFWRIGISYAEISRFYK